MERGISLQAVKDGEIIFTSNKFGIMPAYQFYKKGIEFTAETQIEDKVTGKGSAMLLSSAGCSEIKTGLISQEAFGILEKKGIKVQYEEIAPYIINRTGDGKCPVETMLEGIDDLEEGLPLMEKFLKKIWGEDLDELS
ncbi:MAG: DUF1893 domain-containing protein [Fusobacteriaceae bacterium]